VGADIGISMLSHIAFCVTLDGSASNAPKFVPAKCALPCVDGFTAVQLLFAAGDVTTASSDYSVLSSSAGLSYTQ